MGLLKVEDVIMKWDKIYDKDPGTSCMTVPGGVVMRSKSSNESSGQISESMVFIPDVMMEKGEMVSRLTG